MKGIILSGGTGSRLYPLTTVVNKQLLPIFDKPMIYYPLSTLISCGIKDICIISSYDFLPLYQKLFGDGEPQEYGVVDFDSNGKALSIEEKPTMPKSKYAIPGLYFYDKNVIEYARVLKPSKRGEYEITDINRRYMEEGNLNVIKMPKGTVWLDAGSPTTLSQASNYIQTVQERQGCKIACIEEDCLNQGFIDKKQFIKLMEKTPKSEYRNYLESIQSYI